MKRKPDKFVTVTEPENRFYGMTGRVTSEDKDTVYVHLNVHPEKSYFYNIFGIPVNEVEFKTT